jgi:dipeptidyl aminopeptidase/acylaminoacyl peptidase
MSRSIVLVVLSLSSLARAELPPLVPRDVLLGNPARASPLLSPDGKRIAYLAPDNKDVLQVWVRSAELDDTRCVTASAKQGIRQFQWSYDGHTIVYSQDSDGDENFHLYGADLDSGNIRDLTPFQGVRADVVAAHPRRPQLLLVQMNLRDRRLMDVYALNLVTGALTLDTQNPGDVDAWTTDDGMVVRAATAITPDGATEIRVREGKAAPWKQLIKAGPDDDLSLLDFSLDGRSLFLMTSLGSQTIRVVRRDLKTGAQTVLAQDAKADAAGAVVHPTRHSVQAVAFAPTRVRWDVVDPSIRDDFAALERISEGDFELESRDLADDTWIVRFKSDRGGTRWFLYRRPSKRATLLFVARPRLEGCVLAEMRPVSFTARDGLELTGYLTLPPGVPAEGLPMVLDVHGGPWFRDGWGWDPEAQWLANRGYAVLQVNFRGSTGYGKAFLHAGDRQWGLKMQDDLTDSVRWAVAQRVADPRRVAIMGTSYGGYAALAGAAFTPELYRCAIDVVGPSNLVTLLRSVPPYWETERALFQQRVGDPDDPQQLLALQRASPLFSAERIRVPVLIGQGANDPRVKQSESEQIVAALEKKGAGVTYVLFPDEGHGFERPENRRDFFGRAERFLSDCLGGRAEPQSGEQIPGSSGRVKVIPPRSLPAR